MRVRVLCCRLFSFAGKIYMPKIIKEKNKTFLDIADEIQRNVKDKWVHCKGK